MTIDKKAFGEALRGFRLRSSMTLKSVAEYLAEQGYDYTFQAVGTWERGESAPPAHIVRLLEQTFAVEEGTLGMLLGFTAGDPLNERLVQLEARQAAQGAELQEIRDLLQELRRALAPRKRGGR